jgi:hypothetical protein
MDIQYQQFEPECKPLVELVGDVMFRISGHYLYQVGANLHPLVDLAEHSSRGQARYLLSNAQTWLNNVLSAHELLRLRACWTKGTELRQTIKETLDMFTKETDEESKGMTVVESGTVWQKEIGWLTAYMIRSTAQEFETLLAAELSIADLYAVTPKRGFDTTALAERGAEIFPPDLVKKVPESAKDAAEAGRCLAFELPNGAGFHLHRIGELVMRRYYDVVSNGKPRPEQRNISAYIDALKNAGVKNKKILSALAGLKNFHRNPLLHPDESLDTIDDAIALFGAVNTIIIYMLKALPPEPLTLTAPPSAHDTKAIEDRTAS